MKTNSLYIIMPEQTCFQLLLKTHQVRFFLKLNIRLAAQPSEEATIRKREAND